MLTRCPACQTTFRVTTEQLKARHGQVRCGSCQQVFDALDALVDALPDPKNLASSRPRNAVNSPHQVAPANAERSFHSLLSKEDLPEVAPVESNPPLDAANRDALIDYLESLKPSTSEDSLLMSPAVVVQPRRWPWVIASSIATIALFVQIAIYYRVEIAVLSPDARPSLELICELAGCTVELPSKVELLSIEASDLHPIDPAVPTQLELTATLRNRAPFAQNWPYLELTLTDTADSAVARRVVQPQEYLPQGRDMTSGFSSQSDSIVSFHLTTDGLPASGYRLYLFYP